MDVDARRVAEKLVARVAQLEMEVAVLQSALEAYQQEESGQDSED